MTFGWPQMMKRKTAAAYCDLSESAFEGEVFRGRLPSPVKLGGRDHWHKPAVDASLERLAGERHISDYEAEFWARSDEPEYRRNLRARYAKDNS